MRKKSIFIIGALLLTNSNCADAQGPPGSRTARKWTERESQILFGYDKYLRARFEDNLLTYDDAPKIAENPGSTDFTGVIAFEIDKLGHLDFAYLLESTGSIQTDFSRFDAVLSSQPVPAPPADRFWPAGAPGIVFDTPIKTKKQSLSEQFFLLNPSLRGEAVLIRLIPHDVLRRYPGVLTDVEVNSVDNLKALKLTALCPSPYPRTYRYWNATESQQFITSTGLRHFYSSWSKFFELHPITTREALMQQREEAISQLGHDLIDEKQLHKTTLSKANDPTSVFNTRNLI